MVFIKFNFLEREIQKSEVSIMKLSNILEENLHHISTYNYNEEIKNSIKSEIDELLQLFTNTTKSRIIKKLNNLYKGKITIKNPQESFINLSNTVLSDEQREFLNLGLNYHIQPKYSKIEKSTNIEILFQDLLQLEKDKTINIGPNLIDQLRCEATKHRNPPYKTKLTPKLRQAARELKENKNIVIKKADKSSTYVILNYEEYIQKLNTILSDPHKFKLIEKDPTENLKKKANKIISTNNAAQGNIKLDKIKGEFKPGYLYGTVKTHKENYPLRPIISQITTPTYKLAKKLNDIIKPYIPSKYSLTSTNDFIDILQSNEYIGNIASLDVESLFTNVPINETIKIIIELAYNHPNIPAPKLPREILKNLLEICTKEAPFITPEGKLYQQVEGVAMGSPLGPCFANYYMGYIENKIITNQQYNIPLYVRYVDDIFVIFNNNNQIENLKSKFEAESVLRFTIEHSTNNKLPFLDVMINKCNNEVHTQVYRKKTDLGLCLNAHSECPIRYKESVIKNYLRRAYKICKSWTDFHQEIQLIKQMLVNNNYSNTLVDNNIKMFINNKINNESNDNNSNKIKIYYQNQMHGNYQKDERIITEIINRNVKSQNNSKKLSLVIYYKNKKTCNLVIKNNTTTIPSTDMEQASVVYKFVCPIQSCKSEYVGLTRLTLKNRLKAHYYNGSIKNHFKENHNQISNLENLMNNTKVILKEENYRKLAIKEALKIKELKPNINIQFGNMSGILQLTQIQ